MIIAQNWISFAQRKKTGARSATVGSCHLQFKEQQETDSIPMPDIRFKLPVLLHCRRRTLTEQNIRRIRQSMVGKIFSPSISTHFKFWEELNRASSLLCMTARINQRSQTKPLSAKKKQHGKPCQNRPCSKFHRLL